MTENKTNERRTNGKKMSRNVKNEYGVIIDFDVAVSLMYDCIREELHAELAPCTEQEFFNAYAEKHLEKFGEEWELAKKNPCY